MVWRKPDSLSTGDFVGPGLLMQMNEKGTSCYVDMAGRLWKCSREQVRNASHEEELGQELAMILSDDLRRHYQTGRPVRYLNITSEGGPPMPEVVVDEQTDNDMPELQDGLGDSDDDIAQPVAQRDPNNMPLDVETDEDNAAAATRAEAPEPTVIASIRPLDVAPTPEARRQRLDTGSTRLEPEAELPAPSSGVSNVSSQAAAAGASAASSSAEGPQLGGGAIRERRDQRVMPYPAPYYPDSTLLSQLPRLQTPSIPTTPSGSNYATQALLQYVDRVGPRKYWPLLANDTYVTRLEATMAREKNLGVFLNASDKVEFEKDHAAQVRSRRQKKTSKPKVKGKSFSLRDSAAAYSHAEQSLSCSK